MIKALLLFFALFFSAGAAQASPLIADLSSYQITMDANFSGTRLFLFGARNDNGDIVAVIRGPLKDYVVRKKEPLAGIWVNRDRMKFYKVPSYYAVAANRPLSDIEQTTLFNQLGIGVENLLTPPPAQRGSQYKDFSSAFLNHQFNENLYSRELGTIHFMGETLFKTVIEFPDDIPPGDYTAEIYLLSDGEIVGMQSTPIQVVKSGLDAFLYRFAHEFPASYGLTAIALALGSGWLASRIFERA